MSYDDRETSLACLTKKNSTKRGEKKELERILTPKLDEILPAKFRCARLSIAFVTLRRNKFATKLAKRREPWKDATATGDFLEETRLYGKHESK